MTAKNHERVARFGATQADCRVLGTGCKDLAIHKVDEVSLIRHVKVELPFDVAIVEIPGTDQAVGSGGDENALVSINANVKSEMADRPCVSG